MAQQQEAPKAEVKDPCPVCGAETVHGYSTDGEDVIPYGYCTDPGCPYEYH